MPQRDVKKILVLRFSSMGDIVMTTAMVRVLRKRFPAAVIDMVVRSDFFELIEHNPHLTRKFKLNRKEGLKGLLTLRRQINEAEYDLIYDAHRSLRTVFMMPFLRAPLKAYYQKHYIKRNLSLLFKLPLIRGSKRFLEKFIEPLAPYGVVYDGLGPEMFLSDASRTSALAKFPLLQQSKKTVGLIPSAQWPGKRWPLAYFRTLIERLLKETSETYVVFGGPSDTFCGDLVQGFPPERLINTQGKLSISESAALIEKCAFVVSNDTGLMHVADALSIPSITFLGPTSGDLGCLPFHPQSIILEKHLWCRPCSKNGEAPCIRKERYCLTRITPEEALEATKRLLAKTQGALP